MKTTKRATDERYEMLVEEVCKEHDCLTPTTQKELGRLLADHFKTGSTDYLTVVHFLHRIDEIDFMTELDLRDLA